VFELACSPGLIIAGRFHLHIGSSWTLWFRAATVGLDLQTITHLLKYACLLELDFCFVRRLALGMFLHLSRLSFHVVSQG
jgi:hypothetical protein